MFYLNLFFVIYSTSYFTEANISFVTIDLISFAGIFIPVPSSLTFKNTTFLLEVPETEKLHIKEDENSGVKWVNMDEVISVSNETRMKPIYQKLINKLKGE